MNTGISWTACYTAFENPRKEHNWISKGHVFWHTAAGAVATDDDCNIKQNVHFI